MHVASILPSLSLIIPSRPVPPPPPAPPRPPTPQIALYYASDLPSLGEHSTPTSKPDTLARLGPPPAPPIKALPAAGLGDAPDGVGAAHLAGGAGTATFAVPNLRWPVVVALQTQKWGRLSVEAVSGPIRFDNPNAPQQVRSGAGPEAGTATVRWATAGSADGAPPGAAPSPTAPRLRWGWDPDDLTAGDVAAASSTYSAADMCGGDAVSNFASPGAIHTAVVRWAEAEEMAAVAAAKAGGGRGRKAGRRRRVFYEAYDRASPPGTTPTARGSFTPLAPDPAATAHLLLVADVGQGEPDGAARVSWQYAASRNTSSALSKEAAPPGTEGGTGFAATSIIVGGDVAYANGHGPVWDAFFTQFGGAFSAAPALFAVGNHELLWPVAGGDGGQAASSWPGDRYGNLSDSGGECGVPFDVRTGGGSGAAGGPDGSGRANPHWFAVDDGPIHVHVYSTEEPFEAGSPQHAWIAADLAGVNRTATPWVVVVGHRPPYLASAYPGGGNASDAAVARDLAAHLEPLWLAAGVDVTFAGHHHSYQRTCAMAGRGRCVDGVRTAAGAAGYDEVAVAGGAGAVSATGPVHVVAGMGGADLTDNAMPWPTPSAWEALAFEHGYVRISATASTLAVTAVRSADGSLLDAFELRKGAAGGAAAVRTLGGGGVVSAGEPDVAAASVVGG